MSYKIVCQKNMNLMSDYKINLPDYKNLIQIRVSLKKTIFPSDLISFLKRNESSLLHKNRGIILTFHLIANLGCCIYS